MKMRKPSTRTSRRTIAGTITITTACTLLLTGCTPFDSAPHVAEQLQQQFSDVDGVASVEMEGAQKLPLLEEVWGSVTMDPDASAEQTDRVAEDLADFAGSHSQIVDWYVTLQSRDITVGLAPSAHTMTSRLKVARDLIGSPGIVAARIEADFREPDVVVQVDDPAALTTAYAAAVDAATSIEHDDSPLTISAVLGDISIPGLERDPTSTFEISNSPLSPETDQLDAGLRLYDLARMKLTLTAASITPEKLMLRVAKESDLPALEKFVAENSNSLQLDLQGGKTIRKADAGPHADAVSRALRDANQVSRIHISEDYLSVNITAPVDARTVFDLARNDPDFADLERFTISVPFTFSVSDEPASFAEALDMAEAAAALPFATSVNVHRHVPNKSASAIDLRFAAGANKSLEAFVTALKPQLSAGGWQVWIEADGHVESFLAQDRITLDQRDRNPTGKPFANSLLRAWNAAAG